MKFKPEIAILKWSVFAGGIYFLLISVAHLFGLKIPGLYIYFNVPSYDYQDKIISFMSFGWGIFFLQAAHEPIKSQKLVRAILIAGTGAIVGLIIINLSSEFSVLIPDTSVTIFWIETGLLALYLIWLIYYYRKVYLRLNVSNKS